MCNKTCCKCECKAIYMVSRSNSREVLFLCDEHLRSLDGSGSDWCIEKIAVVEKRGKFVFVNEERRCALCGNRNNVNIIFSTDGAICDSCASYVTLNYMDRHGLVDRWDVVEKIERKEDEVYKL